MLRNAKPEGRYTPTLHCLQCVIMSPTPTKDLPMETVMSENYCETFRAFNPNLSKSEAFRKCGYLRERLPMCVCVCLRLF